MNVFPKGARVCFVGDSITHNNGYVKHIAAWYRANLPEHKVEIYNCGISGGGIGGAVNIFQEDTAIHNPTHIVLMIGGNDSRMGLLEKPASANRYNLILEAFERYKKLLAQFCEKVHQLGAELILCSIPPYDEYGESIYPARPGGYALFQSYGVYVKEFAKEHGLQFCDMYSGLVKQMQLEKVYERDRLHPNVQGHAVLAKSFLAFQGVDYEPPETFPEEIEEWAKVVQKFRGVIQAECVALKDVANTPSEERIAAVKKRREELLSGAEEMAEVLRNYYIGVMDGYLENKPHQEEYLKYLRDFMKNQ